VAHTTLSASCAVRGRKAAFTHNRNDRGKLVTKAPSSLSHAGEEREGTEDTRREGVEIVTVEVHDVRGEKVIRSGEPSITQFHSLPAVLSIGLLLDGFVT
jgi:hypothetical protein